MVFSERGQFSFDFGIKGGIIRIDRDDIGIKGSESVEFSEYIKNSGIDRFYITGADATACVKSACFNMAKAGYNVRVISDRVAGCDLKKMDELLACYADKGCEAKTPAEYRGSSEGAW